MQLDLFENKIDRAIRRLIDNEPKDKPYYGATSGGKDSITIMRLAEIAGVNVEWYCHLTSVDPPELLRFIRKNYPEVKFTKPELNMWQLIIKKRMPPTRKVRYCCEYLKEGGGKGRVVITGVRRAESAKRAKRQSVEGCLNPNGKIIVNPIIDWSNADVWWFIRDQKLKYCSLYDEGFKRLGCVGCPMAGTKGMLQYFERWPYFKRLYIKAFGKMLKKRLKDGLLTTWTSPEGVFDWWVTNPKKIKKNDAQRTLFE